MGVQNGSLPVTIYGATEIYVGSRKIYPTNVIPTQGLIGYYNFEEDYGTSVLKDSSGLGNDGTRDTTYGEIVTGGKVGTYCLYVNTDDKPAGQVARSQTFDYSNAVSFMGWLKSENASRTSALGGFFYWTGSYPNQRSIAFRGLNTYQSLVVGNSVGGDGFEINNLPSDGGVWTHYAVTWGGANNTVKVYINGVQTHTNDLGYFFAGTTVPFEFLSIGGGWGKKGWCDDIAIYNRVLTADEISAYYTATA